MEVFTRAQLLFYGLWNKDSFYFVCFIYDFLPVASRAFNVFDLSEVVKGFEFCLKKTDPKEKSQKVDLKNSILVIDPLVLIRASDVKVGSCFGSAFFDRFP